MIYFLLVLFVAWTWLWHAIGYHDGWQGCMKMIRKAAVDIQLEIEQETNER